jgi:hypothetical protein
LGANLELKVWITGWSLDGISGHNNFCVWIASDNIEFERVMVNNIESSMKIEGIILV